MFDVGECLNRKFFQFVQRNEKDLNACSYAPEFFWHIFSKDHLYKKNYS